MSSICKLTFINLFYAIGVQRISLAELGDFRIYFVENLFLSFSRLRDKLCDFACLRFFHPARGYCRRAYPYARSHKGLLLIKRN